MRITRVRVYHQWQPFRGGTYTMTVGASEGVDSLVVALDTDEGLTGWGELGVVGSFYADAFASVRVPEWAISCRCYSARIRRSRERWPA